MDYVRSFYTSYMIFRTGDPPVKVTWKPASPGALCFPFPHNFGSSNWNERNYEAGAIGEQNIIDSWIEPVPSTRPGRVCACSIPPTWWATGIPVGEQAPATDAQGVPLCCSGPLPCNCEGSALPNTMTATFPDGTCAFLAGVSVTLNRDLLSCSWQGSALLNFGIGTITITFRFGGPTAADSRIDWVVSISGDITGGQAADDSSTCSPRMFVFNTVPLFDGTGLCSDQTINIS